MVDDLFAAAVRSLPHGPPALLIERVLDATAETLRCTARFPAEHPLVHGGVVHSFLAVEAAAQAAAAHLAVLALRDRIPLDHLEGFLIGFKNMALLQPELPAERELVIDVRSRGSARGMHKYRFQVALDEAPRAHGELSTYVQTITR